MDGKMKSKCSTSHKSVTVHCAKSLSVRTFLGPGLEQFFLPLSKHKGDKAAA